MGDSLFTIELPLLTLNEDLEIIKKLYPNYDPYFIASGCIEERRDKFNNLWNQFQSLADRHFLSEIKTKFHERTWEMYLGCVLLSNFPKQVFSQNSGPDFILNRGELNEVFIEAVACTQGILDNAVPDMPVTKEITVQNFPHDKILLRLSSSIQYKATKYKKLITEKKKPYIIAVNKGALGYQDPFIPLILKCLFGIGHLQLEEVNGQVHRSWTRREFVKNNNINETEISMSFFEQDENAFVSAVIYSSNDVLNSPENIGTDCIVIHNPNATSKIDIKTFSFLKQWKAEYENGFEINEIEPF